MATIAKLAVALDATTGAFTKKMSYAQKTVHSFSNTVSASKASILKWGGILTSVALGGGVVAFVKRSIDAVDQLNNISNKLGIRAEALQTYEYAARLADVETSSLVNGLQRFNRTLGEALTGTEMQQEAFMALGLDINKLQTMGPEKALEATVNAIKNLDNAFAQAAIGQKVFGRGAMDMLTFILSGKKGIAEAGETLRRFGAVLTGADFAKIQMATDQFDTLKTVNEFIGRAVAVESAPLLGALAEGLTESIAGSGNLREAIVGMFEDATIALSEFLAKLDGLKEGHLKRKIGKQWYMNLGDKTWDAIFGTNYTEANQGEARLEELHKEYNKARHPLTAENIKARFDEIRSSATKRAETMAAEAERRRTTMANTPDIEAVKEQLEAIGKMQREADALRKSLQTPAESIQSEIAELNTFFASGLIDYDTYIRGMSKAHDDFVNATKKLNDELGNTNNELTDQFDTMKQIQSLVGQGQEGYYLGASVDSIRKNPMQALLTGQLFGGQQGAAGGGGGGLLPNQLTRIMSVNQGMIGRSAAYNRALEGMDQRLGYGPPNPFELQRKAIVGGQDMLQGQSKVYIAEDQVSVLTELLRAIGWFGAPAVAV